MADLTFEAIGTRWTISTPSALDPAASGAVARRIEAFDATYSRFRPDSLVSRIARQPGTYVLPSDAGPLLDLYRRLHDATGGAVTPLVGRTIADLGYDATYSLRPLDEPTPVPVWDDVLDWDGTSLTIFSPVLLDFGAAGKGYLVDLVAEVLEGVDVHEYVIDAGGDLRQSGGTEIRVALEHPGEPQQAIGVVRLQDASLCGSAANRRAWGDGLHHVIDGRTGHPTRDVVATWALAGSALVADGVATALFFADALLLAEEFGIDYVRLFADGHAEWSRSLPGELFG